MRHAKFLPLCALAACSVGASSEVPMTPTEPSPMTSIDPAPPAAPHWARTELDLAAPAEFETATFALG